ncbi:hypothetical protein ACFX1X_019339 [Malus domestica]
MGFQRSKRRAQKSKRPTKKIKDALAFSKAELAQKPRPIFFSRFVNICHMQSKLCGNHRQFVEAPIPTICFSRRVNICHMQSKLSENHGQFVEAPIPTICFSRRVNICHMQGQLSGNYGQSVEDLL